VSTSSTSRETCTTSPSTTESGNSTGLIPPSRNVQRERSPLSCLTTQTAELGALFFIQAGTEVDVCWFVHPCMKVYRGATDENGPAADRMICSSSQPEASVDFVGRLVSAIQRPPGRLDVTRGAPRAPRHGRLRQPLVPAFRPSGTLCRSVSMPLRQELNEPPPTAICQLLPAGTRARIAPLVEPVTIAARSRRGVMSRHHIPWEVHRRCGTRRVRTERSRSSSR